jgi:hypothetical protein
MNNNKITNDMNTSHGRKPEKRDLEALIKINKTSKLKKCGHRLAKTLKEIDPSIYAQAEIYTGKEILTRPSIRGTEVYFHSKSNGKPKNIDSLPPQFRWDAVQQIWNNLNVFFINDLPEDL